MHFKIKSNFYYYSNHHEISCESHSCLWHELIKIDFFLAWLTSQINMQMDHIS
jgi:hypothetical protein